MNRHHVKVNDDNTTQTKSTSNIPPSMSEPSSNSIWASFDKEVLEASTSRTPTSTSVIQIRQFSEEELLTRTSDPLLWWKSREVLYPTLSKIAKKRLGIVIVATSVPSERIYSKAGQLVSERLNRLKPDTIEKILFLNSNM